MNKELILSQSKEEIIEFINIMSFENVKEVSDDINQHLSFIEKLSVLPINDKEYDQKFEDKRDHEGAVIRSNTSTTAEHLRTYNEVEGGTVQSNGSSLLRDLEKSYQLVRHLRGGYLPAIQQAVPESVIRTLELEDGDFLFATPKTDHADQYYFELAKKGEGTKDDNRVEIKYGIVREKPPYYIVEETVSKPSIVIGDVIQGFIISKEDVEKFHLQDGSIIDLAFYEGKPKTAKVVWVYQTDDVYQSPLKSGSYKDNNNDQSEKAEKILANKTVVVIGNESNKNGYEEAITARGGNMLWLDGNEKEINMRSTILKADVVLILVPSISHYGAETARKICKEGNIDHDFLDSLGIHSIVNAALEPKVRMEKSK